MLKRRLLNLRKLWLSLLLMVGATAIAVPGIQEVMDGNVAEVNGTGYPTLQAAVDAAQQAGGSQTISLIGDVSEETVTIKEVANFKLTIDGKKDANSNYTVDARIVVDGLRQNYGGGGSPTNGASVTIQNIDFVNNAAKDVINPNGYPHHLTIQDCTYTGSTTSLKNWFMNVTDGPLYGATIKNVTVESSRLIQGDFSSEVVFESIVATNNAYVGFNIKTGDSGGYTGTVLIKDCQVTTAKYAFRDYSDAYEGSFTLKGNTFISTSTESDEGAIVNRGGKVGTAHINVVSGSYTGAVKILNNKEGVLSITGGTFSEPVPASTLTEGYGSFGNADGTFTVKEGSAIAKIGDNKMYETLEAAFAAAQDGETITLLADCTGNGIKAPQGKFTTGLTVDFAGFTYTVDGSTVGSTGTETNGFQLLKGNKITFKNGTITSEKAKILVQNYSDLTLEGMTLTLDNKNYTSAYTLSNNNGNIVIDGTTINANEAGGFAFDVCRYSSYPSVGVTVKGESVINGDIEVSASKSDAKDGFSLMLESCTLTGEIVLDTSAKAAMANTPDKAEISKNNTLTEIVAPDGYDWKDNGDGTSSLALTEEMEMILIHGNPYPVTKTATYKKVTYKRTFENDRINKFQCWFVPFDYTITGEEGATFYKVHLISATQEANGVVENINTVNINIEKMSAGEKLSANRPYIIKASKADYEFVVEPENGIKLYAPSETSRLHLGTAEFYYDFYGTYDTFKASAGYEWISLTKTNAVAWNSSANASLSSYCWYIKVTSNDDNADYSKISLNFVEVDDDFATNVNGIEENTDEIEGIYSANGVKTENLSKGLNIIKYKNGKTKKIYK